MARGLVFRTTGFGRSIFPGSAGLVCFGSAAENIRMVNGKTRENKKGRAGPGSGNPLPRDKSRVFFPNELIGFCQEFDDVSMQRFHAAHIHHTIDVIFYLGHLSKRYRYDHGSHIPMNRSTRVSMKLSRYWISTFATSPGLVSE